MRKTMKPAEAISNESCQAGIVAAGGDRGDLAVIVFASFAVHSGHIAGENAAESAS